ncbi:MAG: sulfite exporter TauE/SafE family protein [Spirochaetales bacterium]|uniref:Probable membrane transporter protein n=1 Tax=Candidatus Thalassospirochaeta sargassi TaxID=3119039 RepID=A0AAJ1IHW4_9SPIO|nr:sulfite exporter TauE/SafE family protein [Spirochaetales bacterium]
MQSIIILLIGLLAGNITGIIGASGVMIVVPVFIILGYSPAASIGASLFIDTIASLIVAWTYHQHDNLVIRDGIWIAAGSILGAQAGSYLSILIPTASLSNSFSIFLLISAVFLWLNGKRRISDEEPGFMRNPGIRRTLLFVRSHSRLFGIVLGLLVGIISGFFGAGGGIMILFILIFVMGFSMHEGIGTSTLIMAFTAASGAAGHLATGDLPIKIAVFGTIGTVIGSRLSAKYANRVNEQILSKAGAILFGLLGLFLIFMDRIFQ